MVGVTIRSWSSIVIRQDLLYAVRMIMRAPTFTLVIVLSLGLGIGATTAVFSIVNAFMLRELPVRDPHQLVEFLSRYPGEPRMYSFGWSDYERYRDHSRAFSEIMAVGAGFFEVRTQPGETEVLFGEYAVGDFFQTLGVRPAIGRLIGAEDDSLNGGDPAVAVLSWPYWRTRFNQDSSILGSSIVVNGIPVTIVGVTARDFFGLQLGRTPAMWVPFSLAQRMGKGPPMGPIILGRLRPDYSLEQARAEMQTLDRARVERLAAGSKDPAWLEATLELAGAAAGLTGLRDRYGNQLLVLMAAVSMLLLVGCLNIATMLAARAAARRHEMAVRVALGAGRLRLLSQLFTESLLLATAGTALGLAIANTGARTLLAALPVDSRARIRLDDVPLPIDGHVLLFAAGTTIVTAVLFGLAPAWSALRSAAYAALRHKSVETPGRRLYEKSLVTIQVAIALVLGSAAVLLVMHASQLRNRDAGFSHESVFLLTVEHGRAEPSSDARLRTYQTLLDRIRSVPGVHSAALAAITPIQGGAASQFVRVEGVDERPDARRRVSLNWVAPQYFETVRTPLLTGRDFTDADEGGPPVVIVNRRFARHYFGDANPIGRRLTLERGTDAYEIVAVAADAKYSSLHEPAPATVYLHAYQGLRGDVSQFAIRVDSKIDVVAPLVRREVTDVSANLVVKKVETLRAQVDASIVTERLMGNLSSVLAAISTLLAAAGLYGLIAFIVTLRTREIAIRTALGATRADIMTMILRTAIGLLVAGMLLGLPLAIWSHGIAKALTPNLSDSSFPSVAAGAAMIALTLAAAALIPARRAARIHLVEALRDS